MRRPWTPERNELLREAVRVHQPKDGAGWRQVGALCGCSDRAAQVQWGRIREATPSTAPVIPSSDARNSIPEERITHTPRTDNPSPLLTVKPLSIVPPKPIPSKPTGMLTAVLYGDTHIPFQDESALRVVAEVIRRVQPNVIANMGDLLDCTNLSRFDKNPKRMMGLQHELDAARAHLAAFRLLAPTARFVYLGGNHEARLQRVLWSLPPQAEALMALDAAKNFTWPKLLGLEELGVEFYDYGEQWQQNILPKWLLTHGSVVRSQSAYTARAEYDRYGKSGASGHTHRMGAYFRRDLNGHHAWVECGCTCKLDPEYAVHPNWAQGCVVLTFEQATGAFGIELVYIREGTTTFRGEWIDAKEGA